MTVFWQMLLQAHGLAPAATVQLTLVLFSRTHVSVCLSAYCKQLAVFPVLRLDMTTQGIGMQICMIGSGFDWFLANSYLSIYVCLYITPSMTLPNSGLRKD